MTKSITIVGAGMAGLLTANLLSRRSPTIYEAQPELPNNHHAILRFRSSIVGDVLGIPFKRVDMIKTNLLWRNEVADALAYAYKNTGVRKSDRSIAAGTTYAQRFIAPGDLIAQMAERIPAANLHFRIPCDFTNEGQFISTMPMAKLMEVLSYPYRKDVTFHSRAAVNIKAKLRSTDAYVSLLVPNPDYSFSRVSITGDELIIELPGTTSLAENVIQFNINRALYMLGMERTDLEFPSDIEAQPSNYDKILPIDDDIRKDFIHWATEHHGVFSLGRFACWKPGLLLDDLVTDIRKIDGWLSSRSNYDMKKAR